MHMLLAIPDEEWDEFDAPVRASQAMTQAAKFCTKPVAAAPFGMCLGGGTEIPMHSALRQAHLELCTGLVETGVGLLPAGGGCKEILLHALEAASAARTYSRDESVEVYDALRQVFETIAMTKVSTLAYEARGLQILQKWDSVTMNRERLVADAKAQAVRLARAGYEAPLPKSDIPAPGQEVLTTMKAGMYLMRQGEYISDHDAKVATHVAHSLAGRAVPVDTPVSEQDLLDWRDRHFCHSVAREKPRSVSGLR